MLVEQRAPVAKEYFAAVTWDGRRKLPVVIFSDMGGIDIEEVAEKHPEHVSRTHFSTLAAVLALHARRRRSRATGVTGDDLEQADADRRDADRDLPALRPDARRDQPARQDSRTAASSSSTATSTSRATRATSTRSSSPSSASARRRRARRARRPPFEIKGAEVDASDHRGVAGNVKEFDGDLGLVIGAGGGSLTLFDAIRKHGGKPANYCEIGGNPSVKKACELTKLILSKPGVKKIAVMMNVVSNTRVDIVARGVIKGCVEAGRKPGRHDRDLPHPRRVGRRRLQDPAEVRRRVLRPHRLDVRGGGRAVAKMAE